MNTWVSTLPEPRCEFPNGFRISSGEGLPEISSESSARCDETIRSEPKKTTRSPSWVALGSRRQRQISWSLWIYMNACIFTYIWFIYLFVYHFIIYHLDFVSYIFLSIYVYIYIYNYISPDWACSMGFSRLIEARLPAPPSALFKPSKIMILAGVL